MAPAVPQVDRLPVLGQLASHARPETLNVPLEVDVVLEDECALVAGLDDVLEDARVAPKGRHDAVVDLPRGEPLALVPENVGDVDVRRRRHETREAARRVRRLEVRGPVALGIARVGQLGERRALGRVEEGRHPHAPDCEPTEPVGLDLAGGRLCARARGQLPNARGFHLRPPAFAAKRSRAGLGWDV